MQPAVHASHWAHSTSALSDAVAVAVAAGCDHLPDVILHLHLHARLNEAVSIRVSTSMHTCTYVYQCTYVLTAF